jgi:glycosyltransferase involved in cell wall biosynthesis
MAAGVPAIVSPVGVNQEIVVHGETGFHCRSNTDWHKALETLFVDAALRRHMGEAGRDRAVRLYSQQQALPKLLALFAEVAARKRLPAARQTNELAPQAHSKPAS